MPLALHSNPFEHEPPQQGWLSPPQAMQVPPVPHRFPAAQLEPPQQGCPTPPQVPHVPAAEQLMPVTVQTCPVQQGCPAPPQPVQVDTRQTVLPMQTSPAQHARPAVPHGATASVTPG